MGILLFGLLFAIVQHDSVVAGGEEPFEVDEVLFEQGEQLYQDNCAACHQRQGTGAPPAFPALAANTSLKDLELVITTITEGRGQMPAFPLLDLEQLASVATYIRNAWGNDFGGADVQQVTETVESDAFEYQEFDEEAGLRLEGEQIFGANCAVCHGVEGTSGVQLRGNRNLADTRHVLRMVTRGTVEMPSFRRLSDREIAGVATHIRNSWGNAFGLVTEEEVSSYRGR